MWVHDYREDCAHSNPEIGPLTATFIYVMMGLMILIFSPIILPIVIIGGTADLVVMIRKSPREAMTRIWTTIWPVIAILCLFPILCIASGAFFIALVWAMYYCGMSEIQILLFFVVVGLLSLNYRTLRRLWHWYRKSGG